MKLKTVSVDIDPKALTFESMRQLTDEFLKSNPKEGKKYWDCMVALRGPDTGLPNAEGLASVALANGNTPGPEHDRITRKATTSAIIRAHMFPGAAGCSSAAMNSDPDAILILPEKDKWDHFDKHMFKAAIVLGIPVQTGDEKLQTQPGLAGWACDQNAPAVELYIPGLGNLKQYPEWAKGQVYRHYKNDGTGATLKNVVTGAVFVFKMPSDQAPLQSTWYMVIKTDGQYAYVRPASQVKQVPINAPHAIETGKYHKLPPNQWGFTDGIVQIESSEGYHNLLDQALLLLAKPTPSQKTFVSSDQKQILVLKQDGHGHSYPVIFMAEDPAAKGGF